MKKVPSLEARRAVIASGLPLSVGILAFNQLNIFREMADRYLNADINEDALGYLVLEFENWARDNAKNIVKRIPSQEQLNKIRPQWISGDPLQKIIKECGNKSTDICNELYGYQLPWLFHSVAQKLDKTTEEARVEVLSKAGLLVECGLPTEAAAKVFLSGVRSRTAALELSRFVNNPSASVSRIRKALLNPDTVTALSDFVSQPTLKWLHLLSEEHNTPNIDYPHCAQFTIETPDDVNMLHVRQLNGHFYLCSTDMRFKAKILQTEELPFDKFADDPRFAFERDGKTWIQRCRDPQISSIFDIINI
ncbi:MAG: hypothetical protein IPJ69_03810 [Deltaproteobacteria bacterium]|nr:MAG: hypothetical protein IPJ69_03810 [Deltaproteobacteria bacterium]